MIPEKNTAGKTISILETLLLLFVFVLPLWPRYAMLYIKGLPDISLTRVLFIVLVYAWLGCLLITRGEGLLRLREIIRSNRAVFTAFAAFLFFRYASILISPNKIGSLFSVTNEFVTCLLFLLMVVEILRTTGQIVRIMVVMVASCIVVSLFGIYEAYTGYNVLAQVLPVPTNTVAEALAQKYRHGYRIQATFENPLSLAEYLAFVIPIAGFFARKHHHALIRIMGAFAVMLAAATIWFTQSRGAWVALMVSGFVFIAFALQRRLQERTAFRTKILYASFVPLVLLLVLAGSLVVAKVTIGRTTEETQSSLGRVGQIKAAVPYVLKSPLGLGPKATGLDVSWHRSSIDNYYLVLALESGPLALIAFLYALIRLLKESRQLTACSEGFDRAVAGSIGLSIVSIATFMLVLAIKEALPFLFIAFGLLLSLKQTRSVPERKEVAVP